MGLADELQKSFEQAGAGVPWILRVATGEQQPTVNDISTDELVHGLTILVFKLHEHTIRLAQEIDDLRPA